MPRGKDITESNAEQEEEEEEGEEGEEGERVTKCSLFDTIDSTKVKEMLLKT